MTIDFQALRRRMQNHRVSGDTAIVEVTARELQELLDLAEKNAEREPAARCKRCNKLLLVDAFPFCGSTCATASEHGR